MACTEYSCRECTWWDMSNDGIKVCPECGSTNIHAVSDEE